MRVGSIESVFLKRQRRFVGGRLLCSEQLECGFIDGADNVRRANLGSVLAKIEQMVAHRQIAKCKQHEATARCSKAQRGVSVPSSAASFIVDRFFIVSGGASASAATRRESQEPAGAWRHHSCSDGGGGDGGGAAVRWRWRCILDQFQIDMSRDAAFLRATNGCRARGLGK